MNGPLDPEPARVLAEDDLAMENGVCSSDGSSRTASRCGRAARDADVLRRQACGTWRFVIDNPWGTD